jgi:serine/threonine protein kinase
MAPEQGMGSKVDARADIYALGTVFYELVTGRKPYIADTPMAVLLKHMTDSLPDPHEFVPNLPEQVEKVLLKAMAKQPEDRYETMAAFVNAMEGLLSTSTEKQSPTVTGPTVAAPTVGAVAPAKKMGPTRQTIDIKQSPVSQPKRNLNLFAMAGGAVVVALLCLVFGFGAYYLIDSIPTSGRATETPNSPAASVISTQTATKVPPYVIEGCSPAEKCPDSVAVWDLLPEGTTLESNIQYKISISPKTTVRFVTGWCAVDTKTLDENLTHMEYVFTIDGKSVIGQARKNRGTETNPNVASVTMYCDYMGGVIHNWTPGQTHKIVFGFKIKESINDGWDTFQPQDDLNIFLIVPDPNVPTP